MDREKARKRERDRKRDEMDESVNFFYQLSATVVAISERNERKIGVQISNVIDLGSKMDTRY